MINIALIGFGIVGGGVAEVLSQNTDITEKAAGRKINIKYILDKRDFPDNPFNDRVVRDIDIIINDPEVSIVVEMMGGSHPAYEFSLASLKAGKSVVTSNKEVVANFGDELLKTAEENHVSYLFEASVGGGIPLVRPLRTSQASENIFEINGILNGTTNYVLTKMDLEGISFNEALSQATELGYAESNPSADIDGIDSQRKICILAALAFGNLVPVTSIYAETMKNITLSDIMVAKKYGYAIKLLGRAIKIDNGAYIFVAPHFVVNSNPLAHINDVYNGIIVKSEVIGDVMYYGKGAGRYPTAGAVVSDIVNIVSGADSAIPPLKWKGDNAEFLTDISNYSCRRYIKLKTTLCICDIFENGDSELTKNENSELEFITISMTESEYRNKVKCLTKKDPSSQIISHIRVL